VQQRREGQPFWLCWRWANTMMNCQLTMKEHGSWIKQLLAKKSRMDILENGREITFDEPVLKSMVRHEISEETIHQFIRDLPIHGLRSLNKTNTRYLIRLVGTRGRQSIVIELEMKVDNSALDVSVSNLLVKY